MSNSLRPHEPQHARPPSPSPTPGVYPNPYPLSWWCHPTISSSVVPFSSCLQSLPASGSFPVSQPFASGGQSIGISASASVPPGTVQEIQDWFPLGWTGWISLQSKGLSRVFSNTNIILESDSLYMVLYPNFPLRICIFRVLPNPLPHQLGHLHSMSQCTGPSLQVEPAGGLWGGVGGLAGLWNYL